MVGTREFLKLAVNGPTYLAISQSKDLADDFSLAPQFIDIPFIAADELVDRAARVGWRRLESTMGKGTSGRIQSISI